MTKSASSDQVLTGTSFVRNYLSVTTEVIGLLSESDIEAAVTLLENTRASNGRLFVAGSGGGAGHASHATCDFRKLCAMEAYCVTDNVSELTARTNDEGWDTSYQNWLVASNIRRGDCLLVFSVGGGSLEPPVSTNLVRAAQSAKQAGATVVGIVGRDGGAIRQIADATVLIAPVSQEIVTPQTEGLQAVIWHLLVSHPRLATNKAKWESLSPVIR